jgi:hypothetical protein
LGFNSEPLTRPPDRLSPPGRVGHVSVAANKWRAGGVLLMVSCTARRHDWALAGIWTFVVLAVVAQSLQAQGTTGKLQGVVRDPTDMPLANAQVIVLGTAFAALTDDAGYYFINNVPAGTYAVQAQFIGYQAARMRDVRVLADQTLTADFRLTGAVVLEAITISAAEVPIVPRDQVTSKSIVTGEDIDQLPVDDALDAIQLQPGVTEIRDGELSIRGGRRNEATVFVDGVPVRPVDVRTLLFDAPTNTLAEASVVGGAMETAFGDAQSGIISFVTRAGGPRFQGTVSYETDEPLGASLSNGYNRFEGAISGPIVGNLTFSVGGTVSGRRANWINKGAEDFPYYTFAGIDTVITGPVGARDSGQTLIPQIVQFSGKCNAEQNPDYLGDPVPCQGKIIPYYWNTDLRMSGRLQYTYGSGSRISLSALQNTEQGTDNGPLRMEVGVGWRETSSVLVLNWVQQIARGRDHELAFDLAVSYQTDRVIGGNLDREQDLRLRDPALGIVLEPLRHISTWDRYGPGDPATHLTRDSTGGYVITRLKTDEDWDAIIENIRYNRGTIGPYANRFETLGYGIPRVNPWGMATVTEEIYGNNSGAQFRYERRWVGRVNIDWQSDRYNRFKIGADGTLSRVGNLGVDQVYGGGRAYTGSPYKFGIFAQDRLDLGDVVIELGVRYDQYDARALFPTIPGRLSTHPAFVDSVNAKAMTCPAAPTQCDPLEWVWYRSQIHSAISPRIRVSFPIADRTGFRFSYAHQTQTPFFEDAYGNNNREGGRFGGDVEFGRTIMIELGMRHAFNEALVIDLSAYNKDKVSDFSTRYVPVFDPVLGQEQDVLMMTNADFGTVRGIEVKFLGRIGRVFSGQASYTLQNSRSTGSDPFDYVNGIANVRTSVTQERQEPPSLLLRTRDDRRHSLQATFSVTTPPDLFSGTIWGAILADVGIFGTGQLRSGLPYTRWRNDGQGATSLALCANFCIEPLQASETPWERLIDLRVTKGFRLGPAEWTLFADARNMFNFTNKPVVFAETGDVVNDLHRERRTAPELGVIEDAARRSDAWVEITKTDPDGTNARLVGAVDVRDLSATCPAWRGSGGTVGCVMLQRTERRFGNGDGLYDVEEQVAALTDWYEYNWDSTWFLGPGRNVRVGVQLAF